jgi:hypothetical protein
MPFVARGASMQGRLLKRAGLTLLTSLFVLFFAFVASHLFLAALDRLL